MSITFDAAVDGTTLDADFVHVDTVALANTGLFGQGDPLIVEFTCDASAFQSGNLWSLNRPQPLVAYPQTGVC